MIDICNLVCSLKQYESCMSYRKRTVCGMRIKKSYVMKSKVSTLSKEEGKDQESIRSDTTPDIEHHMDKWQKEPENII